ncbi:hypothetical protein CAJAP_04569 [Camponotus japonicus]
MYPMSAATCAGSGGVATVTVVVRAVWRIGSGREESSSIAPVVQRPISLYVFYLVLYYLLSQPSPRN